jgi:predicted metalloprotease
MVKPAYLLGVLTLLAAAGGIALQDPPSDPQSDPKPVSAVASLPTAAAPVQVSPSPAPRSTKPPVLMRDQLYTAGKVAAVSCALPGGALDTKAALVAYGRAAIGCLERGWKPVATRADNYLGPAPLVPFEKGTPTPCGEPKGGYWAFYCDTNQTIYFLWKDLLEKEIGDRGEAQIAMLQLMTHEYGHHLQLIFGIDNYYAIRYDDSHGDPTLIESRRMELQATCLGAAFLGANRASLRLRGERLRELNYYLRTGDESGEPHDHGSDKNNELWTRAAFKSMNPGSCNTWIASPKKVS